MEELERDATVRTARIKEGVEGDPKWLPAEYGHYTAKLGHKSNRMLILRDYIVSAASQINAGGGSNGKTKVVAVVKSSLIDLELAA